MAEKQQVKVTILNQTFSLVTSGDPNDTLQLANGIDELMNSIAMRAQNLDSTRVSVLASLHLADQLRTVQNELARLQLSVQQRSRRLGELLDSIES